MKLKISAIGKLKSGPERELFQRYLTRSGGLANQLGFSAISLREFSESKNNSPPIRKQQEAEQLISTANKGGILLAFDENGKDLTSAQFAAGHGFIGVLVNKSIQYVFLLNVLSRGVVYRNLPRSAPAG